MKKIISILTIITLVGCTKEDIKKPIDINGKWTLSNVVSNITTTPTLTNVGNDNLQLYGVQYKWTINNNKLVVTDVNNNNFDYPIEKISDTQFYIRGCLLYPPLVNITQTNNNLVLTFDLYADLNVCGVSYPKGTKVHLVITLSK
jgi:hypothetical protein